MVTKVQDLPQTELIGHWIAGERVLDGTSRRGPVFNPATGQIANEVLLGGANEVATAVSAARKAFPEWSIQTPSERARGMYRFRELLENHAERLAGIVSSEHGKTFSDGNASIVIWLNQ